MELYEPLKLTAHFECIKFKLALNMRTMFSHMI